ncbi:MAG: TIGR04076 family protein [Deltaproteobacteria bacterium]|nr:TIGR04076 family protein [Deltaproteobacteria bacterium]
MAKCRITVLETQFNEKLAQEYGVENFGPCPFHKVGQVFGAGYVKPEGFCDEAWKCIQHYVFAIVHGAQGTFFRNQWVWQEGVAINSCNDGLRPVIFKVERIHKQKDIK